MTTRKFKRYLSGIAVLVMAAPLTLSAVARSADLNLEFQAPERFTDIEPGTESREQFRQRALDGIEQIFTDLAETLPDDQVLNVKVTDVNLAGSVDLLQRDGSLQQLRVVRQSQTSTLNLEYSLVDANGNVLQEGEERLRGRGLSEQLRRGSRADGEMLRQEREMITRWFTRTFETA